MDSLIEDLEDAAILIAYARSIGPSLTAAHAQDVLTRLAAMIANAQDEARHHAFLLATHEQETAP
jgi:hypothetical protein